MRCEGCGEESDMFVHVVGGALRLCYRCMRIISHSIPKEEREPGDVADRETEIRRKYPTPDLTCDGCQTAKESTKSRRKGGAYLCDECASGTVYEDDDE